MLMFEALRGLASSPSCSSLYTPRVVAKSSAMARSILSYVFSAVQAYLWPLASPVYKYALRVPGAPAPCLPSELPPARSAVVVIDIQPCWWSESSIVRTAFPQLPDKISALLREARKKGVPVVHVRAGYEYSPHVAVMKSLHPTLNKTTLPQPESEPWAAEIAGEPVVFKSTFDGFQGTTLKATLDEMQVTRVYLCGLVTSACVLNTAFGAFHNGLEAVVIEDCTADRSMSRHRAALALYDNYVMRSCAFSDIDFVSIGEQFARKPVPLPASIPPTSLAIEQASKQNAKVCVDGFTLHRQSSPTISLRTSPTTSMHGSPSLSFQKSPDFERIPFLDKHSLSPSTTIHDLYGLDNVPATACRLRLRVNADK